MVTLHETEVDGVRCFWVDTGRPTLAAWLVFRSGLADESITDTGFLHLLEHLSLNGRGGGPLHVNGQVSLVDTMFQAHGPHDLVSAHLDALTAWLARPGFDELERERRVLQAEAGTRGSSPTARALGWRYGATGPGLSVYDEVGLGRATPERLAARAAEVFTQGNAVLVLDGAPPPSLRLRLPDGVLQPLRPAVPCEERYPAMYVDEAGVIVSGVVPRSVASSFAAEILNKELADRLRFQDGNAYAPWAVYERVDESSAVVVAGSDVQPPALPTLLNDVLGIMRHLRVHRTDEQRLEEFKSSRIQGIQDPYAEIGVAVRAAYEHFAGRPPLTLDEMVAEVRAVTTSDVVSAFKAMHATLLVGVPGASTYTEQIRRLEAPTGRPKVRGRSWRSVNWPGDASRLRISDEAVELVDGKRARTIPAHEVHAMLAHENGLRHLVTVDGYGLTINPHAWRRGQSAVECLDRLVPAERVLPQSAADGIDQGVRAGAWRRWRVFARAALANRWVLAAILVPPILAIWVAGFVVLINREITGVGFFWALLGGSALIGVLRGLFEQDD
ncbi:peptidase M16 family protein [Nocardioides dilutus]